MALHYISASAIGILRCWLIRRHCQTLDEVPLRQMKVIVTFIWHIYISHTIKVHARVQLSGSPLSSALPPPMQKNPWHIAGACLFQEYKERRVLQDMNCVRISCIDLSILPMLCWSCFEQLHDHLAHNLIARPLP